MTRYGNGYFYACCEHGASSFNETIYPMIFSDNDVTKNPSYD